MAELTAALNAFPNGSAGGPDGLRPQYLNELAAVKGDLSAKLKNALAAVCDLTLQSEVPPSIVPVLFGANLFPFIKKDGGDRPIAVGCTLRRLVSGIIVHQSSHLKRVLQPIQHGFATKFGIEAAVHSARVSMVNSFHNNVPTVFVKPDVKNAFNSLDGNKILEVAREHLSAYHKFISQCYSNPNNLMSGPHTILSQRGVQQGDPMGPLLHCLSTIYYHKNLRSELVTSFLDDDALGGKPDAVTHDLTTIIHESKICGLELNINKCEMYVLGGSFEEKQSICFV